MAAAREALAAHPPAQADHSAQAQADMVRAGWANWKVDSNSYVPYRTREEAEACVRRSEISATQEGPYEVAELFHIREGSDTKAQAGEVALPEPVANASKGEVAFFVKWTETGAALRGKIPLHTADQLRAYGNARALAAGAGMQERDAKDAARYRWLREGKPGAWSQIMIYAGDGLDKAVDAAIATKEAKGGEA
jgi:hypothetical protein